MTPTWYDLLGVEPDATTDEIRGAWRDAVAELDPTDRRFAVLNRAAKVLLDPDARTAYDAELAERAEEPADEEPDGAEDGTAGPATAATSVAVPPAPTTYGDPDVEHVEHEPPTAVEPVPHDEEPAARPDPSSGGSASLVVAILAAVSAFAFLVIAVIAVGFSESEAAIESGTTEARSVAEEAIVPILSYDATDLEAGRSTATSYLTDSFAEDYERLFDGVIADNASELGVRVETQVLASGVIRGDADRVQVLLFVDQTRFTGDDAEGQSFSNQVTVTLARTDGDWLVDDLETSTAGR